MSDERFHLSREAIEQMKAAHSAGRYAAEQHAAAQRMPTDLSQPADLKAHLISAHEWEDGDFYRNSAEHHDTALGGHSYDDYEMSHAQLRKVHDHEHVHFNEPHVTLGNDHFHEA